MAKFCTECGKEIPAGVAFCTECGTKAPADPVPTETQTVTEAATAKEETPVVHTTPAQNNYQAQQTYTPVPAADPTNKVVGTGAYFGLMLLFALPIIGFIACIIMCFAPKNKNLKHFARANLIWAIIGLIIAGLVIGGIYLLSNTLMDYINGITDGQFSGWGDIFGNLGDLGELGELGNLGDLGELEDLIEQFGNGGYETLPIE